MCTILTVSREFFESNRTLVESQIERDYYSNGDGFSLLAYNKTTGKSLLFRIQELGQLLALVPWVLESYDRLWLHSRYATTGFKGLNGCHGFAAGDWSVMHNGILKAPAASKYRVDSEFICTLIDDIGATETAHHLVNTESYANCFLVNTKTGEYIVTRTSTGSLYTDGQGNYSSNPIGDISLPAKHGVELHEEKNASRIPENYSDFIDWVFENEYDYNIPKDILDSLSYEQLDWLDSCSVLNVGVYNRNF